MKQLYVFVFIFCFGYAAVGQVDSLGIKGIPKDSTKTDTSNILSAVPLEATKYIPPTPTAAAFARYGDIPVNYHTGLVNQDIPIYTFTSKELSLPLSLSYHFSGNKVEDVASWVGLGMSLNAGGVITRSVQGTPDEGQGSPYSTGYYARSVAGVFFSQGGNQYSIPRPLSYPAANCTAGFSMDFNNALNGEHDTEPDIFFFNVAGYSGKFVFDSLAQAHLLPEQDIKIEAIFNGNGSTGTFNQFVLTTPDGNQYFFGGTHGDSNFPAGNTAIEKTHTDATNPVTSSWYLTKIVSADQQSKIYLSYQAETYAYYDLIQESIDYSNGWQGGFTAPQNFTKYRFQGVRLSSIYSSDGNHQANFIADSLRLDVGEYGLGEFSNLSEAKYLNEIQVLIGGIGFKKFVFTHDYFQASAGNITNSFKPFTLQNNPTFYQADLKRLRLLSLQEKSFDGTKVIPPYVFEYENTISFPRRLCYSRDHWGYYNGNEYNGATINNSLMHIENGDGITGVPSALVIGLNWRSNRSANPAFSGVGVLQKVTYPTGGYTVFESASNQRGTYAPSLTIGGLRILSISNHDANGNRVSKKVVDYLSSGILYTKPTYFYTAQSIADPCSDFASCYPLGCPTSIVSSATLLPLNNSQGSPIGYREVKVSEIDNNNGASNGYQLFTYNTDPPITENLFPGSYDDNGALRFYNYPLNPLRPHYRQGTLALEEILNASNVLIQKVSYNYVESSKIVKIPALKIDNHTVGNISGGAKYYNFYTFKTGRNNLRSKTTTQCQEDGTNCIISTENYEYGSSNHFQMTRKSVPMSSGDSLINTYKYSFDYNLVIGASSYNLATNGIKSLQEKHKLVPIEEVSLHKNTSGNVVVTGSTLTHYNATFLKPSARYLLEITYPFLPLANFVSSHITNVGGQAVLNFDSHYPLNATVAFAYNSFGNIAQIEQPQNSGRISSFLWGYNGSLLLGHVQNATANEVTTALATAGINTAAYSVTGLSASQRTALQAFRTSLPHALVQWYTHRPHIGLSSTLSPNGLRTSYAYDGFGKLNRRKDNQGNLTDVYQYKYAGVPLISGGMNLSPDKNAIVHSVFRKETTDSTKFSDIDFAVTTIQYLDGLGRPIQKVGYKHAEQYNDIILENTTYNAYGNVMRSTLPAPAALSFYGNDGSYKPYADMAANFFYNDLAPFQETTEFDNSPLNRPKVMYGAGQAWRNSLRNTQLFYGAAGTDVRFYTQATNGDIVLSGTYPPNSLFKQITVDEQRDTTLTLTDKQGRMIEQWVQDATGYMVTHYVYDAQNRPLAVIQPEGYRSNSSFSYNSTNYQSYVFAYEYDTRGRVSRKHVPNAGWTNYVYDKLDRVVLEQSALQATTNKWSFTKYDALGRNIISGELVNELHSDTLQTLFNAIQTPYESWQATAYSSHSFPISYAPSDEKQVRFYDHYEWINPSLSFDEGLVENPSSYWADAKGLATGFILKEASLHYPSVMYYDNKQRILQTFTTHIKGGNNSINNPLINSNTYSFTNQQTKQRTIFQFEDSMTQNVIEWIIFDVMDRPIIRYHSINSPFKKLIELSYDAIGRERKKVFLPSQTFKYFMAPLDYIYRPSILEFSNVDIAQKAVILSKNMVLEPPYIAAIATDTLLEKTITGLQTINYDWNIRNKLGGINLYYNGLYPKASEGDLFSMKYEYETWELNRQWGGNIGRQTWKNNTEAQRSYLYTYDPAKRLKTATYQGVGAENYSLPNINYDRNGNITNLQRNGKNGSSFGAIDNLNYAYSGNRLNTVADGIGGDHEVDLVPRGGGAYTYWADGSLKSDDNEQIQNITYDTFLKQPTEVLLTDGRKIKNYYDGSGTLLKTVYFNASNAVVETWEYIGGMVFKNGVPYQIATPEGRAVYSDGAWHYEFDYKDHLGNTRVSFRDSSGVLVKTAESHFDPYGVRLNGIGSQNSFQNKWELQGKEKESTFGLNRVNFGARTLNPTTGVWDRIDPLAELDFHLGAYTYVGNNPINAVDLWGMKRVPIDGTRNYYDDETGELTVVGDKNNVNAAFGFDLMYQAHARNKREFGQASPFRKNFQEGGAIAAGVAATPLAAIAATELGAVTAIARGANYLANLRYASAGRWLLRSSKFLLKPRIGVNLTGATADFGAQFLTNGYSLQDVNYWSVGGNVFFNNPLWSGAITTISSNETDRTFSNFVINSAGNALGNGPGLLFEQYSKVGLKATTAAGANARANFMGNIVSRGVSESVKKQENE